MPNPGSATPRRAASRMSVTRAVSEANRLTRFGGGQAGGAARRTGAGLRPEKGHRALNCFQFPVSRGRSCLTSYWFQAVPKKQLSSYVPSGYELPLRTITSLIIASFMLLGSAYGATEAPPTLEGARALYRQGRLSRSAAFYERLVKADPGAAAAWLDLAAVSRELGRYGRAIAALESARALEPQNPDLLAELGWLFYHQGTYDRAHSRFDEALLLNQGHTGALLGAAVTRLSENDAPAALSLLNRLKDLRPNQAAVYYFLGLASRQKGRLPDAIEQWTAALLKDWAFAETRIILGNAYETMGDADSAWGQYARYLNAFPRNDPIYRKQQALHPRLIKKPGDIIPFVRLAFSPHVEAVPETERLPYVRIGLNTNSQGRPQGVTTLTMRFAGPFQVVGTRTGKVYAQGGPKETWRARMAAPHHLELIGPDGRRYGRFRRTLRFEPLDARFRTFIVDGVPADASRTGWDDREYRGELELTALERVISPVNRVNVEAYLLGVVPAEVPARWPMEVLKVQAVIARNQTLLRKQGFRRHGRYYYDLCDSQHCQVYQGVRAEDPRVRQAVLSTRGQVAYYRGGLANTLYHSTCGGFTQRSSDLSGWHEVPYLQRRADGDPGRLEPPRSPWEVLLWIKNAPPAYCNAPELSPGSEFRWLRIIPAADLQRHLGKRHRVGRIRRILPVGRTESGNVREIQIEGSRQTRTIKRENLIRYLLGSLRSTLFLAEAHLDPDGAPESFWVYGGGWGHAVGLCQTGAAGQAAAKKSCADIIRFYYPGATLRTLNY